MKQKCPICRKMKKGVSPKIVGSDKVSDPRFLQKQHILKTVVMCDDCLKDYKNRKIEIKI